MEELESRQLLSDVSWDGGAGDDLWHSPANWSNDQVPGVNDNVTIDVVANPTIQYNGTTGTRTINSLVCREMLAFSGGDLTINAASSFSVSPTVSNGTLRGAGDLTFAAGLDWQGGAFAAGGGRLITPLGSTTTISVATTHGLDRTWDSGGTVNFTGQYLRFGYSASQTGVVNIQSGSVFNVTGEGDFELWGGPGHAVNVAGQLNKSGAGTTTTAGVAFNITGAGEVNVQSGTLQLSSGGANSSTTPVDVDGGGFMQFSGTYAHNAGTLLRGAGTLTFSNGTNVFPAGTLLPTGPVNFTGADVTINNTITPSAISALTGGTVTFNAAQSFPSLTLSGGAIAGSGFVTLTNTFNWSGGGLAAGGGRLITAPGSTTTISVATNHGLDRVWDSGGTVNFTGQYLRFGYAAGQTGVINIQPGSVFNVTGEGDFEQWNGSGHAVNVAGQLNKSGAGTTTTAGVAFNITGAGEVNVQSGTLQLSSGGANSSTTPVDVDGGGFMQFSATYAHNAGTLLRGAGTLTFSNGTNVFPAGTLLPTGPVNFTGADVTINNTITPSAIVALTGGTVAFNADQSFPALALSGGTLSGSGHVVITSTFNWSGGSMAGTGRTTLGAAGVGTISIATNHGLDRAFDIAGSVDYTGQYLRFGYSASQPGSVNVLSTGTFTISGDGDFEVWSGSGHVVTNAGQFIRSGTAQTDIAVPFSNLATGHVQMQSGTLRPSSGGTAAAGSAWTGPGVLIFDGGNFAFPAGTLNPSGTMTVASGSVTINSSLLNATLVTVGGGTLDVNSPSTIPNFTLNANGVLAGVADLTVNGVLTWGGGNMLTGGRTVLALGATGAIINGIGHGLDRTLEVAGSLTYSGQFLRFGGAAGQAGTINILASGNLSCIGDADLEFWFGSGHAINNAGTFTRSGAATQTDIFVPFNNLASGQVQMQSGTLRVISGGTAAAGSTWTGPGAVVFDGGTFVFPAGTLNPSGTMTVASGSVTINGSLLGATLVTVRGGTLNVNAASTIPNFTLDGSGVLTGVGDLTITGVLSWTGGSMLAGGRAILAAGATGTIANSVGHGLDRTLDIGGFLDYSGQFLRFGYAAGQPGVINVLPNGVFSASGDGDLESWMGNGHAVNISGTFTKSGAGTTTSVDVRFTNNGVVRVIGGTLSVPAASAANYADVSNTLAGGAWNIVDPGTLLISDATIRTLAANTAVTLDGPNSTFGAFNTLTTNSGTTTLANGRAFAFTPTGNTLTNPGTFNKAGGGTTTVPAQITFNNTGTVNVTGGTLAFAGAAAQVPQISGTTLSGGAWRITDGGGGNPVLSFPAGVAISIIGGGASVTFSGSNPSFPAVQNLATVNGLLAFANGAAFTLTPPAGTLANTGTVRAESPGTFTLPATLTINNGLGTVAVTGGELVILSTVNGGRVLTSGVGTLLVNQATSLGASVENNGRLTLGVNRLTLTGDYTQGASGSLRTGVIDEFTMGNIVASGNADLGGQVVVEALSGFDPSFGNVLFGLDIVRVSGVRTNEFVDTVLPSTAVGAYAVRYRNDRSELLFNIADFNGDGGVDGADIDSFFQYWEDGSPFADVNGDGGVDGADVETFFIYWEAGGR